MWCGYELCLWERHLKLTVTLSIQESTAYHTILGVSLENLVLDQLKIPKLIYFLILITFLLDLVFDIVRRNSFLVAPRELMKGLMTSATETLVYDICLLQTVNWLTLSVNWLRVIMFIRGGTKNTCIFLSMWERTCSLGTRLINNFFTSLFRSSSYHLHIHLITI